MRTWKVGDKVKGKKYGKVWIITAVFPDGIRAEKHGGTSFKDWTIDQFNRQFVLVPKEKPIIAAVPTCYCNRDDFTHEEDCEFFNWNQTRLKKSGVLG